MKYYFLVTLTFLSLVGIFGLSGPARAITVSPVKVELEADPGQVLEGEIELFNEEKETVRYFSSFLNFEASGESGAPSFTDGDTGLATWIDTATEVTIESGRRAEIPFTVTVPKDIEPGGYFASIFWGTSPPQPGNAQVSIGGKIGVLVLLNVRGETEQGAGILDLSFDGKKIISGLPTEVTYRFSNDGGARVKPVGQLTIKNLFGRKVTVMEANPRDGNVLPNSIRKFRIIWLEKKQDQFANPPIPAEDDPKPTFGQKLKNQLKYFMFGFYSAEVNLTYGPESSTADKKIYFFVLPWQLLSLVLVALLIIFFGFKQYNKWLIKKVTGGRGATVGPQYFPSNNTPQRSFETFVSEVNQESKPATVAEPVEPSKIKQPTTTRKKTSRRKKSL